MYGGMPPHACPGFLLFLAHNSLRFSRILTLHTQILRPVKDPNAVNTNPYTCTGSLQFKKLLMLGKPPNNSKNSLRQGSLPTISTLPYANADSQRFTHKTLGFYRFLTIQTIPYSGAGF
ncbi:hypothetical protein O181_016605 [Austropuccinia psidii MF-1]|uniref:Uncharacterized protein n=1 Tax=Austropuccinia psidii MF-1 TaxID=1389203 RepID=A0A9Q3GS56_9BASI|nr:hypothetical protein [Austropuccinia psidii MF-1]